MDNTTVLEYLPCEVLEHIASYLSVKDILACCATSSLMRHVFSGDPIWRKKCNLEFVDYLNKSKSLIEPSLEWSEVMDEEQSNLSPLPTWRKNYMMRIRLFENWRRGRYDKDQFEIGINDHFGTTAFRFYENDFIFFHTSNIAIRIEENGDEDIIFLHTNNIAERMEENEKWSVKQSRFLHSTFVLNFHESISCMYIDKYKIVGNKLVVSIGNLVLIYDICSSSFSSISLCHTFLFDLSEKMSSFAFSQARTEPGYFLPIKHIVRSIVCDYFFIGVIANDMDIHIWSILSGKKIAVERDLLNNVTDMVFVTPDDKAKHFIVKKTLFGDRYKYHYNGYDLVAMKFSSFNIKHNYCDVIISSGKFVIGFSPHKLFSYNYETSKKLAVRKFNHYILRCTVIVVGSNLLCGTADRTVFIMNPVNLNIINSVKLGFNLYSLKSICNRFVIIKAGESEIWEMGKTVKKLFRLPCDCSFVAINKHCTKIALEKRNTGTIVILTFW